MKAFMRLRRIQTVYIFLEKNQFYTPIQCEFEYRDAIS